MCLLVPMRHPRVMKGLHFTLLTNHPLHTLQLSEAREIALMQRPPRAQPPSVSAAPPEPIVGPRVDVQAADGPSTSSPWWVPPSRNAMRTRQAQNLSGSLHRAAAGGGYSHGSSAPTSLSGNRAPLRGSISSRVADGTGSFQHHTSMRLEGQSHGIEVDPSVQGGASASSRPWSSDSWEPRKDGKRSPSASPGKLHRHLDVQKGQSVRPEASSVDGRRIAMQIRSCGDWYRLRVVLATSRESLNMLHVTSALSRLASIADYPKQASLLALIT